jgi:LAO/AO transport system kinase
MVTRPPFDVPEAVTRIRAGSRSWIARAITLVESSREDHRAQARDLLAALGRAGGDVVRVGVTGVPGAGKSTFIDALGSRLTAAGHHVAVLAVDPSSTRTGGSILGDKTRMAALAGDPRAFVRPSPTAGTLGGVARATREAMVIVEAAGYDVVIVETVGVGQSETTVAQMVDTFLLLTLARSGDQLQGIKKGVLELADVIAVNKADGAHEVEARRAARELAGALHLLSSDERPAPGVLTCSAREGSGLDEVWQRVLQHHRELAASGELGRRRQEQLVQWTWALVRDTLLARLSASEPVRALTPALEAAVRRGELAPAEAAARILQALESPVGPVGTGWTGESSHPAR